MAGELIKVYRDLEVYQWAFNAAMEIFEMTKKFPIEERYSLTDLDSQILTFSLCKLR
jgi:hypothetical protein